VIVGIIVAVVLMMRSSAATKRQEDSVHEASARAMGGTVIEPLQDREVARYTGTVDGIAWTLRVASIDDAETPRNTRLIWATESVRSDRVLVIMGNDINTGESMWGQLVGSGYRLDVDPTADAEREVAGTRAMAEEIEELRKREPDAQRWFAAAQEIARRHGIDGQPPPVVTFGQSAREMGRRPGLPDGFRVFAHDESVAQHIVDGDVISAISRWHASHQGFLRIWVGGPTLRFMVTEIRWPSPESFRDLLNLGLLLAKGMKMPAAPG
jgi:hypothetical protein